MVLRDSSPVFLFDTSPTISFSFSSAMRTTNGSHDVPQANVSNFRKKPCYFHSVGKCTKGEDCRFSHTMSYESHKCSSETSAKSIVFKSCAPCGIVGIASEQQLHEHQRGKKHRRRLKAAGLFAAIFSGLASKKGQSASSNPWRNLANKYVALTRTEETKEKIGVDEIGNVIHDLIQDRRVANSVLQANVLALKKKEEECLGLSTSLRSMKEYFINCCMQRDAIIRHLMEQRGLDERHDILAGYGQVPLHHPHHSLAEEERFTIPSAGRSSPNGISSPSTSTPSSPIPSMPMPMPMPLSPPITSAPLPAPPLPHAPAPTALPHAPAPTALPHAPAPTAHFPPTNHLPQSTPTPQSTPQSAPQSTPTPSLARTSSFKRVHAIWSNNPAAANNADTMSSSKRRVMGCSNKRQGGVPTNILNNAFAPPVNSVIPWLPFSTRSA